MLVSWTLSQNGTTMNRLFICIILLGIGTAASAETLYRWIEPDGSITFSPEQPPAGVDFKAVDSLGSSTQALGQTQPSIVATSEHTLEPALPPVNSTKILTQPTPTIAARQGLTYAPETSSRPIVAAELTTNTAEPTKQAQNNTTVQSSNKHKQCQDLSKRVVSLERRLTAPLQAADMDNTVVAMARYQRSYDQHCTE